MQPVLLLSGVLFHAAPVWKACARVGFPFDELVYPQLATGERSVSARQAFDLVALADTARQEPVVARYLSSESTDLSRWRLDLQGTVFVTLASGVIVEVGGVLSHASTIAREYGLPALANVKHATRRLRTGERVKLDALHGRVHRLQQPDAAEALDLARVS